MLEGGTFPADYVWNAQEAFALQIASLDRQPGDEKHKNYYLRNLLISLDFHFINRDRAKEIPGGALAELRDATTLFVHDGKAPIARAYYEELVNEVFVELAENFLA